MASEGVTRRQALILAGAGAVTAGVGTAGVLLRWGSPRRAAVSSRSGGPATTGDALREPEVVTSAGGTLHVTLTAASGAVEMAGRSVRGLSYNGSVPGPTLRVRPGDRVTLDLENRLGAATNLHAHGLHVSPEGNSDNVFLHVEDGETFRYEYQIPPDHPSGTFWYHPHLHGTVAAQLFGGMLGAIVVDGDDAVQLPAERERLLVVTDVTLDGDRVARVSAPEAMLGREGELVLVNGQAEPVVTVAPGSFEHWRVVNGCSSRFLRLRLDGGELVQVAGDAGPLAEPLPVTEALLAPGNRVELLVRVAEPGQHRLVAEPVDRGTAGMGPMMGGPAGSTEQVTLLHVQATGATSKRPELPTGLAELEDLRGVQVDGRQTLTLAMGMGMGMGRGMGFTIDGREFDPDRTDTSVRLGGVEEWTVVNSSTMDHPFHLHVWPMQVTARDGTPAEGSPEYLDVVNVPARGTVVVRVRFDDFPGRTVYHCHILDHEDLGMMGVLEARG